MGLQIANNVSTSLTANIGIADTTVNVDDASEFPVLGSGDYCYGTLVGGSGIEIVKVTTIVGNVLTIIRAQDETTAKTYVSTERIELRNNAQMFRDYQAEAEATAIAMAIALG